MEQKCIIRYYVTKNALRRHCIEFGKGIIIERVNHLKVFQINIIDQNISALTVIFLILIFQIYNIIQSL